MKAQESKTEKRTMTESFSDSIDQLGHRVLGALNMSDPQGIQSSFQNLRQEVMTEIEVHPIRTLASVVGVGFLIAHAATSGKSQIVRMIARGAGVMATGWFMERLSKSQETSKTVRH